MRSLVTVLALTLATLAHGHSFDVRDSIEMATFSVPSQFEPFGRPVYSPDGKRFCVVTTRGLIVSDQVESTLRVFDVEAVRRGVAAGAPGFVATSQVIASIPGNPGIRSNVPFESIITEPHWSRDSSSLYFLALADNTERRLFVASLLDPGPRPLTPVGRDVLSYDAAAGVIAYLYIDTEQAQAEDARRKVAGVTLNQDARSVAGLTLGQILLPEQSSGRWFVRDQLALIRDDVSTELPLRNGAQQPLHLLAGNGATILALSPDGRQAVELLPARVIPQAWSAYEPALERLRLHPGVAPEDESVPRFYARVDLSTGDVIALTGPYGQTLGYPDKAVAIWSRDGRELLVTNAVLVAQNAAKPCVAVVIDMRSQKDSCVTRDRSPGVLIEASLARGNVQLGWQYYGKFTLETYHRAAAGWQREAVSAATDTVSVRQTLNERPALWATDMAGKRSTVIWDPNPQLRDVALGEASVYRWKDASGYEWSAGLIKPVGYVAGRPYPLVIQTHGFIDGQFLTDGSYPSAMAARPLASAGFVVLQMNARRTHSGTFAEATDQVAGFKAAIEQLTAMGLVDPQRVGIVGFSRTCWYAETALIEAPELFAVATIADGIDGGWLGRTLFGEPASSYDELYGGKPVGASMRGWIERAPDFHRDAIRAPVRLEAHSSGSILGEWGIYAALSLQNKPVDLIYIPQGQHILQRPLERLASQQGNVDWLRFWLQGYEDRASVQTEPYDRWEKWCAAQSAANPGRPTFCATSSDMPVPK